MTKVIWSAETSTRHGTCAVVAGMFCPISSSGFTRSRLSINYATIFSKPCGGFFRNPAAPRLPTWPVPRDVVDGQIAT